MSSASRSRPTRTRAPRPWRAAARRLYPAPASPRVLGQHRLVWPRTSLQVKAPPTPSAHAPTPPSARRPRPLPPPPLGPPPSHARASPAQAASRSKQMVNTQKSKSRLALEAVKQKSLRRLGSISKVRVAGVRPWIGQVVEDMAPLRPPASPRLPPRWSPPRRRWASGDRATRVRRAARSRLLTDQQAAAARPVLTLRGRAVGGAGVACDWTNEAAAKQAIRKNADEVFAEAAMCINNTKKAAASLDRRRAAASRRCGGGPPEPTPPRPRTRATTAASTPPPHRAHSPQP